MGWIAVDAGPELASFPANLRAHLTELSLSLYPGNAAHYLQHLGILTALQSLIVRLSPINGMAIGHLFDEKLTLKLPHLETLGLGRISGVEIVLSCPKLVVAQLKNTCTVRMKVEDAALTSLVLSWCSTLQLTLQADQLQSLKSLSIAVCSFVGTHLIEEVSQMRQLQTLKCNNVPIGSMPKSFPQCLQEMNLEVRDFGTLASEVQLLNNAPSDRPWGATTVQSLAELLSMDSFNHLQLEVVERVLQSLTAKGMEGKGVLHSGGTHKHSTRVLIVHDPLETGDKSRCLKFHLPPQH